MKNQEELMMYFQTETGSMYYMDTTKKLIWGGCFGNSQHKYFDNGPIMVGLSACFDLGGKTLRTSKVIHIN